MVQCFKCVKPIPTIDDKNPKIMCFGCERQICVKCSGLLATELRVIQLQSPTLKYLCCDCELGVRQLPALRNMVTELKTELEELKTKQNQTQSINLEMILDEIGERERRSSNVILFGVSECPALDDNENAEARKKRELTQVREALSNIPGYKAPVAAIRLGKIDAKPGSGPRPIKVIFSEKQSAVTILRNGKKLPSGMSAKNDMTPYQRDYLIKLRQELEERTKQGETELTIKYINNNPKILKTKPNETTKK